MAITKETKELADALFIRVMPTAYAKFAQEMPSGAELADLCKNSAVEYDKYWQDIPIIDEPDPDLLWVDQIQENLKLFLPGGVAPQNEKELVDLFRLMSKDYFGYTSCTIQTRFPDCIAQRDGEDPIRIEFEYLSSNFSEHKHQRDGCDAVFCWINDWPGAPAGIEVAELQNLFGFGFNVWFQSVKDTYAERIGAMDEDGVWSVARRARKGDLILFYRVLPEGFVADIFLVAGQVTNYEEAGWKEGKDWMAPITRVCSLASPLHYKTMQSDVRLKDSPLMRSQLQGRPKASAYWDVLLEIIVESNSDLAWLKDVYGPHKLGKV
jgi:hypothetical protein